MKAVQLKTQGTRIAVGSSYLIYEYQEQNHRQRVFYYLVKLRGQRYCLIRRLDNKDLTYYKQLIKRENGRFKTKNN